jgi:hypothetical protein
MLNNLSLERKPMPVVFEKKTDETLEFVVGHTRL